MRASYHRSPSLHFGLEKERGKLLYILPIFGNSVMQVMDMTKLSVLLSVAGLLATAAWSLAEPEGPSTAEAQKRQRVLQFDFKKTIKTKLQYLLFLPQDYAQDQAKVWPMIFFLHGAGERGTNVWKAAVHGPPKYVNNHPDFPFIVVSPQCPENEVWSKDILLGLLDDILRRYRVDSNRVYLTGLSMGGYGTWDLGLAYPEKFAAIVPICGGGSLISILLAEGQKADALKGLGVWAFHGAKDPIVPEQESQRMVALLKSHGVQEAKLTVFPEAGHDCWTQAYSDAELYKWLLEHQRNPPSADRNNR